MTNSIVSSVLTFLFSFVLLSKSHRKHNLLLFKCSNFFTSQLKLLVSIKRLSVRYQIAIYTSRLNREKLSILRCHCFHSSVCSILAFLLSLKLLIVYSDPPRGWQVNLRPCHALPEKSFQGIPTRDERKGRIPMKERQNRGGGSNGGREEGQSVMKIKKES